MMSNISTHRYEHLSAYPIHDFSNFYVCFKRFEEINVNKAATKIYLTSLDDASIKMDAMLWQVNVL